MATVLGGWLDVKLGLEAWNGDTDYFFVPLGLVSDLSHRLK